MRKTILSIFVCTTIGIMLHACQPADDLEMARYLTGGQDLYRLHCQNCHGAKGEGLGQLSPPLTDTLGLKSKKQQLACYIRNGMSEKIVVDGKVYEEKMPSFPDLKPIDLAKIIVYITNSFGNKQGIYHPEQVTEDLKSCR